MPPSTPAQLAYSRQYRQRPENREKERLRSRTREKADPDIARKRNARRRARKAGAFVENVESLVVLEMDDGTCGICGEDVDPEHFDVDHIVPLSCGGAHAYFNVQAAHPHCNVRKHVKSDVPVLPYTPLGRRSDRAMAAALPVREALAQGLTYREAASRLGLTVDQIRWRVGFLRSKGVDVSTRKQGHRRNPHLNGWHNGSRRKEAA